MLERWFERILWSSRLVVIVAVVASLVVSVAMFYIATVDVVAIVGKVLAYSSAADLDYQRATIIRAVVEVVDGYLLAAIMLIFALGLYELFVSRIDAAEGSEFASRLLLIRSLDDLKDRLAKVVLLILVVKFFAYALQTTFKDPLDLLYLALGTALVAGAIRLSHAHGPPEHGSGS
ncbi:MAG: YqhA family protein [Gemmatimonadales bacterium]